MVDESTSQQVEGFNRATTTNCYCRFFHGLYRISPGFNRLGCELYGQWMSSTAGGRNQPGGKYRSIFSNFRLMFCFILYNNIQERTFRGLPSHEPYKFGAIQIYLQQVSKPTVWILSITSLIFLKLDTSGSESQECYEAWTNLTSTVLKTLFHTFLSYRANNPVSNGKHSTKLRIKCLKNGGGSWFIK